MKTYYVDENGGNDSNDGLSEANAWRTSDKVNASIFDPGDWVRFKRGGSYGNLIVPSFGSPKLPISFGAYGSYWEGPLPKIEGDDVSIYTNDKPHLAFKDLRIIAPYYSAQWKHSIGLFIEINSFDVSVDRCQIEGTENEKITGILARAQDAKILHNEIWGISVGIKFVYSGQHGGPGICSYNVIRDMNTADLPNNDGIQVGDDFNWRGLLISHNDISGWQEDAIDAWGRGIIIEHNHIHDAGAAPISTKEACKLWGEGAKDDAPIIFRNNWIHDIDGHGPAIHADNVQAYGNRIHNISQYGMLVDYSADIFNNAIYTCGKYAITVYNAGKTIIPRVQGNLLDGDEYDLRVLNDCAVKGGFNILRNDASVTLVGGATYNGEENDRYEIGSEFISLLAGK